MDEYTRTASIAVLAAVAFAVAALAGLMPSPVEDFYMSVVEYSRESLQHR